MEETRHPEVGARRGVLSRMDRWARRVLIAFVHGYQATFSRFLGGQCRFFPTCSCYAEEALLTKPLHQAMALAMWRILRCNPLTKAGYDPVPHAPGEEVHYLTRPHRAESR